MPSKTTCSYLFLSSTINHLPLLHVLLEILLTGSFSTNQTMPLPANTSWQTPALQTRASWLPRLNPSCSFMCHCSVLVFVWWPHGTWCTSEHQSHSFGGSVGRWWVINAAFQTYTTCTTIVHFLQNWTILDLTITMLVVCFQSRT